MRLVSTSAAYGPDVAERPRPGEGSGGCPATRCRPWTVGAVLVPAPAPVTLDALQAGQSGPSAAAVQPGPGEENLLAVVPAPLAPGAQA
jgi:hypothetical protein